MLLPPQTKFAQVTRGLAIFVYTWPMMAKNRQEGLGLREASLLGLLFAQANPSRVPARPWPVAAACASLTKLGQDVDANIQIAAAAAGGPDGEATLEGWLRQLASEGVLRAEGTGMFAHWIIREDWLDDWRTIVETMDARGRQAWDAAVQSLSKALSIWEKTLAAASRGSSASAPPA